MRVCPVTTVERCEDTRNHYVDSQRSVYIPTFSTLHAIFAHSAIGVDVSCPRASGCRLQNVCKRMAEGIRGRDNAGGIDEARCMMEHACASRCFTTDPMLEGRP
jgi:hypothetical protein